MNLGKLKNSLGKLALNKETVLKLSDETMNGIKGGVTQPTNGCHSAGGLCGSFGTDCFSQCQPQTCNNDPNQTFVDACTATCAPTTDCHPV